jgi:hypothetical protein
MARCGRVRGARLLALIRRVRDIARDAAAHGALGLCGTMLAMR